MRVFYISSGRNSLSYLDPNIIDGFTKLAKKNKNIRFYALDQKKISIDKLIGKVRIFKPDVIISLRGTVPLKYIRRIKLMKIPVGIWLVDDPYNIVNHLKKSDPYDFVITQDSSCIKAYQEHGKDVVHIPLAVNPELYHPMQIDDNYKSDICFVGTGLPARIADFDNMADYLKSKKFILIGKKWDRLKSYDDLKANIINSPIPPSEVAKYYNGAKIVLNIHRINNDIGRNPEEFIARTPNNRTFDIAACKAFQLATSREDLENYYKLNKEIVDFTGIKDLIKKIEYYLKHDNERIKIAERGYQRTISSHTYVTRLEELVVKIQKEVLKVE